ncbi:MAG TPA: hypothetical protein ENK57_03630, partial [Polyangiaceae bacterium]|nr:hypothetical protein [Polyangiaceae bacterium]
FTLLMLGVVLLSMLRQTAYSQPQPLTTLSGQLELARVVDLSAERLSLNIEYDASKLKGSVTLRLGGGVTDDELWSLTNRLLSSRGLTTVRRSGDATISVVLLSEAAAVARVEPASLLPAGVDHEVPAGFRTVIVDIEHGDPASIVDAIKPLLGKSGKVTRVGESKKLLLSATAEGHKLINRFLTDLDAPDAETKVVEIAIRHLGVERLMVLVEQMQASRELVSGRKLPGKLMRAPDGVSVLVVAPERAMGDWRSMIERLDRREPVTTERYAPSHFGLEEVRVLIESTIAPTEPDDRWRVVTDTLTGSLIITATASQHEQITSLMDRLSEAPPESRRPMRSWTMKNRAVDEVISVLEGLISAGVLEATADDGVAQEASHDGSANTPSDDSRTVRPVPPSSAPLLPRTPSQSSTARSVTGADDFTLTADVGTNTLIAVGSPRMLDQLDALLATIDVRQPQVMIEVLMIALTDAQTRDLAIQLDQVVTKGGTLVRLSSLFGLGNLAGAATTANLSGAGGTAVVLDPGDFGVLVRALETINDGRTLSMPRLLATNNIPASFNSTVNEPFLSTNASDTVATTSFGGSESAGTQITVTPQIASGDHLVLEYDVTLSAFVGESADPSLPPARQQNVVSSTASIPDGYTVAVGGFEFTTEGKSTNQVPLIAKIPLFGELFKSRSASSTRTRFYVFIRANVLRSDGFDDLKYLSDQLADETHIDTGWPTVEPRVIK